MPIVVEVPNRGSIEFADGTSDADIDAIVSKEFPPTQEDSYQKVLGYEQGASDETPSKDEYLAYLQAKKTKPLLGERPMATLGEAALETGKMLATLPYRAGEAISETAIMPPEGVTRGEAIVGTAAEVAARSETGARKLLGGLQETILSEIDSLAERYGQTLRSDDDKYQAFLGLADVKRKLAKAQMGEQPAAQEFLQAYNIPQEALSPAGLEVGGFVAAPENIAFAGGGKLAGQLLGGTARALPAISGAAQRTGARIGTAARVPEVQAGRAVTAITGSEAAGQAVERAIGTGTTGVAAAEALGLPVAGNIPIPGAGMAASAIGTAKAVGAGLETLGEAGAISGGEALSPIQRGLLGFGERIAAQEGASRTARAFGNVLARTGADVIVPKTASILVPALGAGAAGGLLAGMTGEEGDQIAAAIGSGFAFGGIESGIRMAAAKGVFDANRVRATATEDLNTRPNDVQFTYIEPVTKAEQTVTLKDRDARAQLYEQLDDKQLVKALSEIANAENAGVDVVFHKDGDPVPQDLQQVRYKGVALSTDSVKSGRPTILVNVDKAVPETIPHEILHARITSDMVSRIGSQIIEGNIDKAQFKSFANKYAKAMLESGAPAKAKAIFDQVKSAFDPKLQRAQRIDALRYMADEFAAYYTQEFLAGKDPKTVLPGRLPSFFEAAFNSAKEAVSDKFTQKALQSGFDPIAKTFYGPDGKRIKIPWMDDAINQLIIKRKGFEPSEQRLDMRKLTPNQQAALVMSRGFEDLYMLNPDGSISRPKTGQELKLQDIDIAQRSIKLLDSLPAADRGTVTGLDAKGNTIIEGRLSLAEADALARSGIYSASTSRYLGDIAKAVQDGSLLNGSYWKVYGRSGRPGVFGESQKLFLPYGIRLNSAGGVIVKVVDFGKVQARMDAALQKQAYKNLFRSYDQAMATLRDVYLKNLADPNGKPSAEALGGGVEGARKRNFFNEVMGAVPKKGDVMINEPTAGYTASRKGGSVYEDLRIERVQNVEQTGMKIPWSGDMGEQSSYRRTQLNFQPAETIGDKSVESDTNAGFRILSSRGKFRLYSPDGNLLGIYDSAGQAKLKAEKTYATQTRLQPEIDQLQRPARNEVRQTAEAGGRNRSVSRTQGSQAGGEVNQQVRQAGDVGRFMPDQQGFYSKLEEVVTNKLPKSATPQQILATVDPAKGSGVKAEELKWTGFAQAVERIAKENGGKVPKEKLMEHLQNEGRVRFEEVNRGVEGYYITQEQVDGLERIAQRTQSEEDWRAYENAVLQFESQELGTEAQYSKYQLPGGRNYREVVLTSDTAAPYTSSHFEDIPNYVAHMRVNERALPVTTDVGAVRAKVAAAMGTRPENLGSGAPEYGVQKGLITPQEASDWSKAAGFNNKYAQMPGTDRLGLFIEEIQSDRHQQARERGYAEKTDWSKVPVYNYEDLVAGGIFPGVLHIESRPERYVLVSPDGATLGFASSLETLKSEYDLKATGIPDAPFRKDWSLQMFKRGLRDAVASGKEWIGWTAGIEQVKRYEDEFRKSVDTIRWNDEGLKHNVVAIKDGQEVFSGRFDSDGKGLQLFNGEEASLSDVVGKDIAAQIIKGEGKARGVDEAEWSGNDLTIGGEGMKGFYDQILPAEVQKYVKQWGGEVKKSNIPEAQIWRVDITPQMRESVQKTGQPRFMPSDTDYLAAVQAGDTQAAQQMVDQAAKAAGLGKSRLNNAGNPEEMYHGSGWSAHNVFERGKSPSGGSKPYPGYGLDDIGFWFTSSKNQATEYGSVLKQEGGKQPPERLYNVFLDIKNPLEFADQQQFNDWIDSYAKNYAVDEKSKALMKSGRRLAGSVNVNMLIERLKMGKKDGIIIWKGNGDKRFGLKPNEPYPTWAIVFDPSQIKSADPITRDDSGNVIPLSQRFQQSSADIRYMPESDRAVTRAVNINDSTQDFTGQILRGEKVIETRDTLNNALQGVLGQRIGITRTGTGDTKVVGYATVAKQPIVYRNESEFRKDQGRHLVEPGSKYDIKKGGVKYGYELTDVTPVEPFSPRSVGRKYSVIDLQLMPQPDPSIPGAYSVTGGFRILPGKTNGRLRVYGPSGSLVGIAGSLDEAQRMIQRKTKSN